jgi:hypothetical protein
MSETSKTNSESRLLSSTCEPFKLPDLLDLHNFSKASTLASDEPSSGIPIVMQIISGINEELKSSVLKHQKIHEFDKQANQNLMMELKKVRNDYLKEKEEWKQREKSLLNEQEVLEKTISTLKYNLLRSQTELNALTSENLRISALNSLKESNFLQITEELKGNPNNLSYSSIELESLRKNSSNSTLDSSDLLRQKDQIINNLKLELSEAKILNKSILLNRQMSKNNDLEEILAQKLRVLKIPGNFIRDPEQSYIYNGKKISLMIKSGQLLCRAGTMFRPFEEFVRNLGVSSKTALSTSHKRFKSLDFQSSDPRTPTSSHSRSKVKF